MKGISKVMFAVIPIILFVGIVLMSSTASATEPEYPNNLSTEQTIYYGEIIRQTDDGLIISSPQQPLKVWNPDGSEFVDYSNLTLEVTVEKPDTNYAVSFMGKGLVDKYYEGEFSFSINVDELFGFYNMQEDVPQLELYYSTTYTDCIRKYDDGNLTRMFELMSSSEENLSYDDMLIKINDKCFTDYQSLTADALSEIRTVLGRQNEVDAIQRRPPCSTCPRWLPNCIPVCPPYIPIINPDLDPDVNACGGIVTPGTYTQTQDLNGGTGTCITITASNVNYNGNGYNINGSGPAGIAVQNVSNNVYNTVINGFTRGISLGYDYENVYNNTLNNFGQFGIFSNKGYSNISNNTLNGNSSANFNSGVYLFSSTLIKNNTIENNIINISSITLTGACTYETAGVEFCFSSSNNTVKNNLIYNYKNATCMGGGVFSGTRTDYYYNNTCHSDLYYISFTAFRGGTSVMMINNITFYNNFDITNSYINLLSPFNITAWVAGIGSNVVIDRPTRIEINNSIAYMDSATVVGFNNVNSTIKFNELNFIDPVPYYNTSNTLLTPPLSDQCGNPPCKNWILNYGIGYENMTLNVTGWSNYAPQENTSCVNITSNPVWINCSCNISLQRNYQFDNDNISITGWGSFNFNGYNISNVTDKLIRGDSQTERCLVYCNDNNTGGCFQD